MSGALRGDGGSGALRRDGGSGGTQDGDAGNPDWAERRNRCVIPFALQTTLPRDPAPARRPAERELWRSVSRERDGHERSHVAPHGGAGQFERAHVPPPARGSDRSTMPPDGSLSDVACIARLVAGDERALGVLFDRHGAMAFGLASAMTHDPADAEEVVADAFAQVWRSASNFDQTRGSVAAWLATIVRTRALDLLRSQKRRARVLDEAATMSDDGESPALSTGAPSPDRGVEQGEAQRLVREALALLPPPQRRVLELAYFGGLSQSEIAEQLSEPLGTVKTRMRAGMEKLRVALRPLMEPTS